MTDRATLEALMNRVLEGTGPDREIDGQLALLKGYTYEKRKGEKFPWWRRPDGFRISIWGDQNKPPPYTASLDAALTLLPDDRDWHVQRNRSLGACWASISPAKHDLKLREWGSGMMKAATPERALMAACLKARMEAQGD